MADNNTVRVSRDSTRLESEINHAKDKFNGLLALIDGHADRLAEQRLMLVDLRKEVQVAIGATQKWLNELSE